MSQLTKHKKTGQNPPPKKRIPGFFWLHLAPSSSSCCILLKWKKPDICDRLPQDRVACFDAQPCSDAVNYLQKKDLPHRGVYNHNTRRNGHGPRGKNSAFVDMAMTPWIQEHVRTGIGKQKHVSPCGTASWVKPNWRHWLWLGALADLLTILRNIQRITLAPTCSHHTDLQSGRVFLRSQCESLSKDILQIRAMRGSFCCPRCQAKKVRPCLTKALI